MTIGTATVLFTDLVGSNEERGRQLVAQALTTARDLGLAKVGQEAAALLA